MSAQPAVHETPDTTIDAEVSAIVEDLLEEHEGFERAALRTLARDYLVLLNAYDKLAEDADRSISRGFLRGVFSEGARPQEPDA